MHLIPWKNMAEYLKPKHCFVICDMQWHPAITNCHGTEKNVCYSRVFVIANCRELPPRRQVVKCKTPKKDPMKRIDWKVSSDGTFSEQFTVAF